MISFDLTADKVSQQSSRDLLSVRIIIEPFVFKFHHEIALSFYCNLFVLLSCSYLDWQLKRLNQSKKKKSIIKYYLSYRQDV